MPNRFKNIDILKTEKGRRYYKNVIYPEIPVTEDDLYIITTGGDRYDTLAQHFYGDKSDWWIIAIANTSKRDGLVVRPGVQLRIPADASSAKNLYEELNSKR